LICVEKLNLKSPKLISFCYTPGEFEAFLALCKSERFSDYEPVIYSPRGVINNYQKQLAEFNKISDFNYKLIEYGFILACISVFWTKLRWPKSMCIVTLNVFDLRHSYFVRALFSLLADGLFRDAFNHYSITVNPKPFAPTEFYSESGFDEVLFKYFNVKDCGVSKYNSLLKRYLSYRDDISNKCILVISKSTVPAHDYIKEYILTSLRSKFPFQDIYIKPHPRENLSWVENCKFDKKIKITDGFYNRILDASKVFIFGGSSGWISQYVNNIVYLDFPEFNRNTPQGRFNNLLQINSLKDLDLYLGKLS